MNSKLVLLFIALSLQQEIACAKCIDEEPGSVDVEILQCQGVKFDSSPSKSFPDSGEIGYMHAQGASVSGTLIVGKVKSVIPQENSSTHYTSERWMRGKTIVLFYSGTASTTCPKMLPGLFQVKPSHFCCDELPLTGECLVPYTVNPITSLAPIQNVKKH